MRAVLDPNILIAALLSRSGAPAQIVSSWLAGEFELVASDTLLAELERALAYPKLRSRITAEEATAFVALLRRGARLAADPPNPARRSIDPGDDYLLALARASGAAVLVSGDPHLTGLKGPDPPVLTPRQFLDRLEAPTGH